MQRSSRRGWGLVIACFALLVLVSWQLFDRPLGQTVISAVVGLIVGLVVVRGRGRGRIGPR